MAEIDCPCCSPAPTTGTPADASDAELTARTRAGDDTAFGELFARHSGAATRLARRLTRGSDADDLVSEAFARLLVSLRAGGGPDESFRGYLSSTVRRLFLDRTRARTRVFAVGDMTQFDSPVDFHDSAVAQFERQTVIRALATLPPRWQRVVWLLDVEGLRPADIAAELGMTANAVSALAYRAREGLRQAYLTMHLRQVTDLDCRWVGDHLGGFVRGGLSARDTAKVGQHVAECRGCAGLQEELADLNRALRTLLPGGSVPRPGRQVPVRRTARAAAPGVVPVVAQPVAQ